MALRFESGPYDLILHHFFDEWSEYHDHIVYWICFHHQIILSSSMKSRDHQCICRNPNGAFCSYQSITYIIRFRFATLNRNWNSFNLFLIAEAKHFSIRLHSFEFWGADSNPFLRLRFLWSGLLCMKLP